MVGTESFTQQIAADPGLAETRYKYEINYTHGELEPETSSFWLRPKHTGLELLSYTSKKATWHLHPTAAPIQRSNTIMVDM